MKREGKKSFSLGWSARLCTILITTSMQFHCRNDFIPSRNQDHSRFWAEAWECAFGNSQKQLISGNCCRICYHIYYQLTNFIKLTLPWQFKPRELNATSHMWCWLFASTLLQYDHRFQRAYDFILVLVKGVCLIFIWFVRKCAVY